MRRRYDAVFLDMGHTLVDYAQPIHELWADALRNLDGPTAEALDAALQTVLLEVPALEPGRAQSVEENRAIWSGNYRRILETTGFAGDLETAAHVMWDVWIRTLWRPYPDVSHVLPALRDRGYTLAMVSNWAPTLSETLERFGLDGYFSAVACSALVGYEKPHARIFEVALEGTGVDPDRVLHIGDNYEKDVLGARSLGMDALLLARPGAPAFSEEPAPPDQATIGSLEDLLELLP